MHHESYNATAAAGAADRLAELLTRLRRLVAGVAFVDPPAGSVAADPRLPRVEVAARLLAVPGREPGAEDLARLGRIIVSFAAFLAEHPGAAQPPAAEALAALDDSLRLVLDRLDEGATGAEMAADTLWDAILAEPAPPPAPAPPAVRPADPPRPERSDGVVMLVAGGFRREQVRRRLEERGRRVVDAPDADAAAAYARGDGALVVCDNLEPSNHLESILRRLGDDAAARRRVVLVVSGRPGHRETERGRRLGLGGVWGEPYDPVQLARP